MKITYVNNIQSTPPRYEALGKAVPISESGLRSAQSCAEKPKKVVSFCAVKPSPMLRTTFENAQAIYARYQKDLEEVSLKDIAQITKNLVEKTGHSRAEVLGAMQVLTRFGNIRSVAEIGKAVEKDGICCVGISKTNRDLRRMPNPMQEACTPRADFNKALSYIIENKGLANLRNNGPMKIAVFLDESRIARLEKLKQESPKHFERLMKDDVLKYYYVSGWDKGINFIDRTKDLETETLKLLEESDRTGLAPEVVIDKQFLERIKALHISPRIISKEGIPTEHCVYNQLAPEKMTKSEFFNLINANAQVRSNDLIKQLMIKDETVNYFDKNLRVYTPEKLSKLTSEMHKKVLEFADSKGISHENILLVEPDEVKSDSLVTYMYKQINKVPDNQMVLMKDLRLKKVDLKDKMLVMVDDCTITGNSIKEKQGSPLRNVDKSVPKLFVCLTSTSNAEKSFHKRDNFDLLVGEIIPNVPTTRRHLVNGRLEKAVGSASYMEGEATCMVLPYMSPDTNTELSSNIALFHNPSYRLSNTMIPVRLRNNTKKLTTDDAYTVYKTYRHAGVKSYTLLSDDVAKLTNQFVGSNPDIVEKDLATLISEQPKTSRNYFRLSTYIDLLKSIFD